MAGPAKKGYNAHVVTSAPISAQEFAVAQEEANQTIAAVLRGRLPISWSAARQICVSGKVFVDGALRLDPSARVVRGAVVCLRPTAPAPVPERLKEAAAAIVYEDSQLVIVDKPSGISSVPYERSETGTAMDLIRDAWRAAGRKATATALHIVHRLDKDSSGLLLFAKTKTAERTLGTEWRRHAIERRYVCVVHGYMRDTGEDLRIESNLIADRGDGLRGSVRRGDPRQNRGKRAASVVRVLETLAAATLCEVELETGKTHQIRIHLAEAGHPLVGERVYVRDYLHRGGTPLPSTRLLLHARTLGFEHPVTGERIMLERDPPPEFLRLVARLRPAGGRGAAG